MGAAVYTARIAGVDGRSLPSATLALASTCAFLVLASALSFVPDAGAPLGASWQLRGPLAARSDPPARDPDRQVPDTREVRRATPDVQGQDTAGPGIARPRITG